MTIDFGWAHLCVGRREEAVSAGSLDPRQGGWGEERRDAVNGR